MEIKAWIQIGAAIVMIATVVGAIWNRLLLRKGIGARLIQFTAVGLVIPSVLILALEQGIPSESAFTILGTIMGYVLGKEDKEEK